MRVMPPMAMPEPARDLHLAAGFAIFPRFGKALFAPARPGPKPAPRMD